MLTLALLGRLWRTARYRQLMRELLAGRPEADLHLEQRLGGPLAAAALGLLRLGELRQAAFPIAGELRDRVLLCQCRDGGWGEADQRALLTALCLRGLASAEGARARSSIERGIDYLAAVQAPGAGWGDAFVTGFVLLQLGRMPAFRDAVCMSDALAARRTRAARSASVEVQLVWSRVDVRCGRSLRLTAFDERSALAKARREPLFAEVA